VVYVYRVGIYGADLRNAPSSTFHPVEWENRRIPMRLALSCTLLASALLCLSACNKAESPEKVQADVAKAQSNAVEENAKSDENVKQVEAAAAKDRADALAKVADKSVGAIADSAVTQAEGETKIALAKCEALEGDAQKTCKDDANAHMDAVRAKAKAAKSD
jgi:Na+-transporting methylmalonyl-CoA/oxaloacetate decarboxylase gamma subunit